MQTLGDAFPAEIQRCRSLLEQYELIPSGGFGATMIRRVLERAEAAQRDNDAVAMIGLLKEMQGCE